MNSKEAESIIKNYKDCDRYKYCNDCPIDELRKKHGDCDISIKKAQMVRISDLEHEVCVLSGLQYDLQVAEDEIKRLKHLLKTSEGNKNE